MLRARHAILALVPMMLVGYAACAGEDSADPTVAVEVDNAAIAARPWILGTFRDEQVNSGVAVLTLMQDYTYHMEEAVVCVRYPCVRPQVDGGYRYMQDNGVNYLALQDRAGRTTQVFKYKLSDNILYLAPRGTEVPWQALPRSDRLWCAEADDCGLQGAPPNVCAGEWSCGSNVCNYQCGQLPSDTLRDPGCSAGGCVSTPTGYATH